MQELFALFQPFNIILKLFQNKNLRKVMHLKCSKALEAYSDIFFIITVSFQCMSDNKILFTDQ